MTVDILIAVAERGGVENIISMTAEYLEAADMHFRVIQMAWEGVKWLDEKTEFYPLTTGKKGHTLNEFQTEYENLIRKTGIIPDVMLAAGWPYLNLMARRIVSKNNYNTKIISWLHADAKRYESAGFGGMEALMYADAHFAISSEIYNSIIAANAAAEVYRIYNPVDIKLKEACIKTDVFNGRLLFVGRLSKEKAVDVILYALAQNNTWRLRVIGTGAEEESLKSLAESLNLTERIEWLGWKENPWEFAKDTDALVMSSVYEGFPLAAIEALSYGIPVISSLAGGIAEIVKNGVTGYLYRNGDIKRLVKILDTIWNEKTTRCKAEECMGIIKPYLKENALCDMKEKLKLAAVRGD